MAFLSKFLTTLSCFWLAGGSTLATLPADITSLGVALQTHSHASGLYPAAQAIDGDLTTFNHTDSQTPGGAWELTFPTEHELSSVEIVSRDCCAGRLNGGTLRLFDGEAEMVFEVDLVDSGPLTTFTAEIPEGTMARSLRIGFDPDENGIIHLAEVRVFGPAGDPPVIKQFEANGNTLTWNVRNADSIQLHSIGSVAASGSLPLSPTSSTAYFLTASNPCDTITASASITVSNNPLRPRITEFNAVGDDWVEIWNPGS